MWVRQNKGNVFVGNLPPDFPDERLAEAFDPFGIVLSAIVARDPNTGARLRYGFVDIATDRAATQAITALDGSQIDGCKLNVKARDRTPGKKPAAGGPQRRPPPRSAMTTRTPHDFANGPPTRRFLPQADDSLPAHSVPRPSQSQAAREGMPEVEPPPRQDFEVVRRPIRRREPTFQVERRPLPRRLTLPEKS
jgi:RNA recognition motif-containing protein